MDIQKLHYFVLFKNNYNNIAAKNGPMLQDW
jgi:hypothetical protein